MLSPRLLSLFCASYAVSYDGYVVCYVAFYADVCYADVCYVATFAVLPHRTLCCSPLYHGCYVVSCECWKGAKAAIAGIDILLADDRFELQKLCTLLTILGRIVAEDQQVFLEAGPPLVDLLRSAMGQASWVSWMASMVVPLMSEHLLPFAAPLTQDASGAHLGLVLVESHVHTASLSGRAVVSGMLIRMAEALTLCHSEGDRLRAFMSPLLGPAWAIARAVGGGTACEGARALSLVARRRLERSRMLGCACTVWC